jgi:DNA-directed RNA polymerase specialized sigma24 family protein
MKLDRAEQERLCQQYLNYASRFLRASVGNAAEEYAGLGLMKSVQEFDTDRGVPFEKFLNYKLRKVALQELRRFNGRPGTARHSAQTKQHSYEDFDGANHDTDASISQQRDELLDVLTGAEAMPDHRRAALIGKFLCDLSIRKIWQITGKSCKGQYGQAIAQLRKA